MYLCAKMNSYFRHHAVKRQLFHYPPSPLPMIPQISYFCNQITTNKLDAKDGADCRVMINSSVGHRGSYSCYYACVSSGPAPARVLR